MFRLSGSTAALQPGMRSQPSMSELWSGAEQPSDLTGQLRAGLASLVLGQDHRVSVLSDVPLEGLRVASSRAEEDQLNECWIVAASGTALPFRDQTFEAITHSDVLCCLVDKLTVLSNCRRLIRPDGRMAFTVIAIEEGLNREYRQRAIESGPTFVDAPCGYEEMLDRTGWRATARLDLTREYGRTVRALLAAEEANEAELVELLGPEEYADRLGRHRRAAEGVEAGLLRRELFSAAPAE